MQTVHDYWPVQQSVVCVCLPVCVCVCVRARVEILNKRDGKIHVDISSVWSVSHLIEDSGVRRGTRTAIAAFEEARVASLQRKRAVRKHQVVSSTNTAWPCDRCNKVCSSRIGLFAHRPTGTHRWSSASYSTVQSMCVEIINCEVNHL